MRSWSLGHKPCFFLFSKAGIFRLINYLLTQHGRVVLRNNIGPRSSLYRPRCTRSVLSWPLLNSNSLYMYSPLNYVKPLPDMFLLKMGKYSLLLPWWVFPLGPCFYIDQDCVVLFAGWRQMMFSLPFFFACVCLIGSIFSGNVSGYLLKGTSCKSEHLKRSLTYQV